MKFTQLIVLAATAMVLSAGVAAAHPHGRMDRREARQEVRLRQGVRQGDLTRAEARRLRARDHRIDRMECRAKADGRLTLRERRRIERAQDQQSRRIYRLRHNGRQS